jgi:hypothetical protein
MCPLGRTVEDELARIAGAAHGVVTRAQLLRAGVTADEIKWRLQTGSLLREHRGAGHLFGIVKGTAPAPEVTSRAERRIEGVRVHRCRSLDACDAAAVRGIPVTTVPRTLVDLAAELSADALARACHEAGVRYGTTPTAVEAVLLRRPTSPGAKKLRRVIHGDVHVTLSNLEARFLKLLRDEGLPLPVTNRPAGGRRVDCRWPQHRLTVELDGYQFHNSRHSWEQDRHPLKRPG